MRIWDESQRLNNSFYQFYKIIVVFFSYWNLFFLILVKIENFRKNRFFILIVWNQVQGKGGKPNSCKKLHFVKKFISIFHQKSEKTFKFSLVSLKLWRFSKKKKNQNFSFFLRKSQSLKHASLFFYKKKTKFPTIKKFSSNFQLTANHWIILTRK